MTAENINPNIPRPQGTTLETSEADLGPNRNAFELSEDEFSTSKTTLKTSEEQVKNTIDEDFEQDLPNSAIPSLSGINGIRTLETSEGVNYNQNE